MYNRLSVLSFCFLLSACVYPEEMNTDLYAQSDLLPPKSTQAQPENNNPVSFQNNQTPPIILPQQTSLPQQILNPQQGQNPFPFVQTIVIPQPTPITYPNTVTLAPQTIPATGVISYPAGMPANTQQIYKPRQEYIVSPKTAHPTQNVSQTTPAGVYPLWARPESLNQPSSDLNVQTSGEQKSIEPVNIPRW